MSTFTIRVSLQKASWADYVALAKGLAAIGVVDVIRSDDGTWYRLPDAEYHYEGDATSGQIMDAVARVADAVKPPAAVLVTQALRTQWRGLQIIKRASAA